MRTILASLALGLAIGLAGIALDHWNLAQPGPEEVEFLR